MNQDEFLLKPETHLVIDGEDAHQIGIRCRDCGSSKVVYAITHPHPPAWEAGAYCYKCLLTRCQKSHMIPTPMPELIYDLLKADITGMGRKKLYFFGKDDGTEGTFIVPKRPEV